MKLAVKQCIQSGQFLIDQNINATFWVIFNQYETGIWRFSNIVLLSQKMSYIVRKMVLLSVSSQMHESKKLRTCLIEVSGCHKFKSYSLSALLWENKWTKKKGNVLRLKDFHKCMTSLSLTRKGTISQQTKWVTIKTSFVFFHKVCPEKSEKNLSNIRVQKRVHLKIGLEEIEKL